MMASQTIKEKFVEFKNSKQTPPTARPKIQRVADHLRNRTNLEKHYSPKLVSIGPIHHGKSNLEIGEELKLMWASKYIENTGLIPEELHKKIADNIDELKGRFSDDVLTLTGNSLQGFGCLEEKLPWMFFVDGCSLLYIFVRGRFDNPRPMYIKVNQLAIVMLDVLLLENQLPYEVLKLLWRDEDEIGLIKSMRNFFVHLWFRPEKVVPNFVVGEYVVSIPCEQLFQTPTHLLDLLRSMMLATSNSKIQNNEANEENWSNKSSEVTVMLINTIYTNIKDLKAVGIRLKSSKTRRPRDIDFSEGWFTAELTLPEIAVDDTLAATFLNLIAYEMCLDFDNDDEISSFVAFMGSLIDHPEDVKVLRSKGILLNRLGSDEEVVKLFKIISTDLVPNSKTYFKVRAKMNDHYDKYKTWIVQGYYTYFSIAAFIAIALTFIQTVFTVYPAFKKDG